MDMFHIVRCFHIALGTIALFVAPGAMVAIKGGGWHRRWGQIYFWAMAGVAATATVMCYLGSGFFLFLVAILSFYLASTGYLVLRRKKPTDRWLFLDWFATAAILVAGVSFIAMGIRTLPESSGWVRIVFGGICCMLGVADLRRYFRPSQDKRAWMFEHMTRFLAAYIATVTAFSVVNFRFLPVAVRWLGPTVVGAVGIVAWRIYYARKFAGKAASHPVPVDVPV
jgi:hypothetical protein